MSAETITIPVISRMSLADVAGLIQQHALSPLQLQTDDGATISFCGPTADLRPGSYRLVTELLHLARFALLVTEVAQCRPSDKVVDAVTFIHDELRSRP
jgi:hypothetical protein